jgi:fatty acid desaturase
MDRAPEPEAPRRDAVPERDEEESMIRALLMLFVVGIVGMVALGLLLGVLLPLAMVAVKVALVLLVGYFILRLVRPDLAEKYRSRLQNGS